MVLRCIVVLLCAMVLTLPACDPGKKSRSGPVAAAASACQQPKPANLFLAGLAYGPYQAGQDPNYAVYPSADEVAADIPTLVCLTSNIRIYSSLGPAKDIVQDAERAHLSVNLGIWLGRDNEANEREMAAGMQLMSSTAVSTVTVGNEVLLRSDLTVPQLRTEIQRVHKAAAGMRHRVQVTTADIDGSWLAHPELVSDVDLVDWATRRNVQYFYFDAFDDVRYSPKEAPSPSPEPTVTPIPHPVSPTPPPPRVVPPPEPTVAPAPSTVRNIYVGSLMDGLDIGIDTSGHRFGWLTADHGTLTLQYPDQQTWGAMFVTVGTPVPAGNRPSIDLSQYRYLSVEMRWVSGAGKCVGLGIKDRTQPDDGTETKVQRCLTSEWTTVTVPLSDFTNADLTHLYVVFEVVFATVPMTVQLRNVRYSTT